MGLVECGECRKEISSEAASCPQCGHPQEKVLAQERTARRGRTQGMGCLIILLALLLGTAVPSIGIIIFIVGAGVLILGLAQS